MLIRIGGKQDDSGARVKISAAAYPAPFKSGLEYSCAARGTWNIVHTGFLLPQSHEIFICAMGCLRGVVLTAAEMGFSHRFSTIEIKENDVYEGTMEDMITDGVSQILDSLDYTPRAVLVYTSCIHHFVGCDIQLCYDILRKRYPHIDFADCYMDPIMRKSGLNPDQTMRRQLYSLIKPAEKNAKKLNIIGNDLKLDQNCELFDIAKESGAEISQIQDFDTYEGYQSMGQAFANIYIDLSAKAAADALEKRLGQKAVCLPLSYDYDEINSTLNTLRDLLGLPEKIYEEKRQMCDKALENVRQTLGGAPVEIDYTATPRPLSLARLLLTHGINVTRLYCDSFSAAEKSDLEFLQKNFPDIDVYATVQVKMRELDRCRSCKTLAIGQKAAYFGSSPYFINIVQGGGLYGYSGIIKLCEMITDAWSHEKDTKNLIQIKGMGCSCHGVC